MFLNLLNLLPVIVPHYSRTRVPHFLAIESSRVRESPTEGEIQGVGAEGSPTDAATRRGQGHVAGALRPGGPGSVQRPSSPVQH